MIHSSQSWQIKNLVLVTFFEDCNNSEQIEETYNNNESNKSDDYRHFLDAFL